MSKAYQIIQEIENLADEEKAKHMARFFKTGEGEYGESDIFCGLTTPQVKEIVKRYKNDISLAELEELINHKYHEARSTSLLILVEQFKKADIEGKKDIVDIYIDNIYMINNWDLVDISAHKILGKFAILTNDFSFLKELSNSGHLWSERASVVANWTIIKTKQYTLILNLAEKFLTHEHDLIHKSVGWMLREMGKVDEQQLLKFLDVYAKKMPRTMLRYSLEKLPFETRKHYMKR